MTYSETHFMGKPISYWLAIEKTYNSIQPLLHTPELRKFMLEQELKNLSAKRYEIDAQIEKIKDQLNE